MATREVHEGGAAAVGAAVPFPGSDNLVGRQAHAPGLNRGVARRSSSRSTRNGGVEAAAENGVGSELLAAVVATAAASYSAHEVVGGADGGDGDGDDEDYVPSASSTATFSPAPAALKNGRMPLVTRLDALVQVPEMEQRVFDTWEHFHASLQTYGQKTFQVHCWLHTRFVWISWHKADGVFLLCVALQRAVGDALGATKQLDEQEESAAAAQAHP